MILNNSGEELHCQDKKVQPSAKKWMTTPISNYDKMPEIFGKDRANGEGVDQMVSQNEATLENYINLNEVDMSSAQNESSSKKRKEGCHMEKLPKLRK
ncbi:hypothetical protein RHMOL_Rhmol06G0323400 [Rhododendron molle]|uniref:Uncharacterized protein n=1 Tax=Rhododendron molle TaxID=49168 RepID=A0ACC0NIG4_RHOML|nr:hypothetical protein RHMOL_Rhmol06G0323400 [Rhododendron molle]